MPKFIKTPWFLWLLVTSIGSVIGFTIGAKMSALVASPLAGLCIGFGQLVILGSTLKGVWRWASATAIGLPLGYSIGGSVIDLLFAPFSPYAWVQVALAASIAGLFIGLLQWLALGRKWKDALRWMLVSALSWGIGITATFSFIDDRYLLNIYLGYLSAPIGGLFLGVFVGIISGVFVESILMQTEHKDIVVFSHAS